MPVECGRISCATLVLLAALGPGPASGAAILPSLIDGETYSFVFLSATDTTDNLALSQYESFATTAAAGSDLENEIFLAFGLSSVNWTPILNHDDGTHYRSLNPAYPSSATHPLYNSQGVAVVSSHTDLWSGGLTAEIFTEDGDSKPLDLPWTGPLVSGTGSSPLGPAAATKARNGNAGGYLTSAWISGTINIKTSLNGIYVISEPLQ